MNTQQETFEKILTLSKNFHQAGSFSRRTFEAIIHYCEPLKISTSVETGAGKSTLLFSHLSKSHKVFAIDDGNGSLTNVIKSPLLNQSTVEIIEGPTQITLPKYNFSGKLQLALIDGPHGYPFPELEYFYIYPLLEEKALLIIDDIDIPTVYNMFQFIKADDMFELIDIVEKTAFFQRTNEPTFSPTGDGWWLQKYNEQKVDVGNSRKKFIKRFLDLGLKMAKIR